MADVSIETGVSKDPQLYNMEYDIGQQQNIAYAYPKVVCEMEARIQEIMKSARTRT